MKNLVDEIIKPFLEIERKDMPQVAGKDLLEMLDIFEENDIAYRTGDVSISQLYPTQENFKPDKVKGMIADLKSNKILFPIVISEDGYIMDGHHRWLATKKLYGEDFKIPAIIIQMPKDKALLMFVKTSNKLNENPDTVYDQDGDIVATYAFPFGYDYNGDMRVGIPGSYHYHIAGFYLEFDEEALPENRTEFELSGRIWPEKKLISFWTYPDQGDLTRVLKDVENELNRLHDEFPDVAEEHEIPRIKVDSNWKIDVPPRKFPRKADTGEKTTKVPKDPNQLSLGLTKNIIQRDTSDRIAGRGDWADDSDDFDDYGDYGGDWSANDIGAQISIDDYTGQTEKEKARAAAQAQAIQHVLPPGDPRKKKRIAPPKRKRAGMNPTQYHQFVYTSEGKTSDKLNENPDMIYDKDGNEVLHHSKGGVPFGYYQGKMYVGIQNTHHGQMKDLYSTLPEFEDTGWKEIDSKEIWGRLWPEQKMISFWKHPEDPEELKNVLSDIAIEYTRKGEVPIKFDNSWIIDVGETENPETFEIKGKQMSVGDYSKKLSYKQFICTTEGKNFLKSIITEDVILDFLVDRDIKKLLTEITSAQGAEVDDGPATFYKNFKHYKSNVDPVAEQMGLIVLDYLISKLEDEPDFVNKVDYRYNIVPVTSYGSSGVGHTRADNPVAKFREHISVSAENVGFEIIDFLGVDLYDVQGVSVEIPHQFKRDKMLLKYKNGETFANDTLEESIKKKINGIEFEFKYNEHEVEPFFTVLRNGIPIDRMSAELSKEEMKAFVQKNFSKWMADYVKSYGGFFTQIPQHGQTHGVYTGMENKENLIDINIFLD